MSIVLCATFGKIFLSFFKDHFSAKRNTVKIYFGISRVCIDKATRRC